MLTLCKEPVFFFTVYLNLVNLTRRNVYFQGKYSSEKKCTDDCWLKSHFSVPLFHTTQKKKTPNPTIPCCPSTALTQHFSSNASIDISCTAPDGCCLEWTWKTSHKLGAPAIPQGHGSRVGSCGTPQSPQQFSDKNLSLIIMALETHSLAYSYTSTQNETQISPFPQLRNLLAIDNKNNSNKSQQRSHVWSTDRKHFFLIQDHLKDQWNINYLWASLFL